MKVIIIGMGRVGATLTEELCKEGHSIVAIEKDPDILQEYVNLYDIQGICGNGCDVAILKEAGVDKCDMLISVTKNDENNILSCIVAHELKAKYVVARVRDPEYYAQFEFLRERLGIGMLINPDESASHEILRILRFPAAMKVHLFSNGKVAIVEFKLPHDSKLEGVTLLEAKKRVKGDFLIVSILRNGTVIIPNGNEVLHEGDILNICAKYSEMRNFFRAFGLFKQKAQSVMILGGGDDVFYLARELEESGFFVKIICNSADRCEKIKSGLNKASVVLGDYTDGSVLEREGIAGADALVAMSQYDENNIVTSLYGKSKGVKKTISVLRGTSYRGIWESLGIDAAIYPYSLAALDIAHHLRAVNFEENGPTAMYKLADDKVEALLFHLTKNKQFEHKALKDIPLRKGILIASVIRGKNVFIPDGNFQLESGDDLLIIVSMGKIILELEDILGS